MRYIELQRALQTRLSELERLCEQERSILVGRWKTHSLPARKRSQAGSTSGISDSVDLSLDPASVTNLTTVPPCCRPASSTEHLLLYNVVSTLYSFF